MWAWRVFKHSLVQVFHNFSQALKISALPMAVLFGLIVAVVIVGQGAPMAMIMLIPVVVLGFYLFGLIAVAWHRYVLLEEHPEGWWPKPLGGGAWRYIGRLVLIGLIIGLPIGIVAMAVVAGTMDPNAISPNMGPAIGVIVVLGLIGGWIGYRLSIILPAVAVDQTMSMGESWKVTKAKAGGIFLVMILIGVFQFLLDLPGAIVAEAGGDAGTMFYGLYSVVTGWFNAMLGLSILTTMYGSLVEERELV
jgi:hypothetical protein